MEDRSEGGAGILIVVLAAALICGIVLYLRRPATTQAIDAAIDPVVPTATEFNARLDGVERARLVRDEMNKQTQATADALAQAHR